jgi:hypothetical protein
MSTTGPRSEYLGGAMIDENRHCSVRGNCSISIVEYSAKICTLADLRTKKIGTFGGSG